MKKILKIAFCIIILACISMGCTGFDKSVTLGNFTVVPATPYPMDKHQDNQTPEWRAYANHYVPDSGLYGRR